jgi:protein SOK2
MYYQNHIPGGQTPQQQPVSSPYSHQQHPHSHGQPPLLQPGPSQYQAHYGSQYSAYPHPMGPGGGPPAVSSAMGGPTPTLPLPGVNQSGIGATGYPASFDTTGQLAPQGMKPRVTATLWEDEGSLCFQVEARGICVARREGWFQFSYFSGL